MIDWNKMRIDEYIEHLETEFQFDSSGTAKSVFELINAYKALTIQNVGQQRELLIAYSGKLCFDLGLDFDNENEYIDKFLNNL